MIKQCPTYPSLASFIYWTKVFYCFHLHAVNVCFALVALLINDSCWWWLCRTLSNCEYVVSQRFVSQSLPLITISQLAKSWRCSLISLICYILLTVRGEPAFPVTEQGTTAQRQPPSLSWNGINFFFFFLQTHSDGSLADVHCFVFFLKIFFTDVINAQINFDGVRLIKVGPVVQQLDQGWFALHVMLGYAIFHFKAFIWIIILCRCRLASLLWFRIDQTPGKLMSFS